MKKLLLLFVSCCFFTYLQAQEFNVTKIGFDYIYTIKNCDKETESCKKRVYLKAKTSDSVYEKIKKDIRACLPPIVNERIKEAIKKKVKVEDVVELFEDFSFLLQIDKEGNVTAVTIHLTKAMRKKFTEEMLKETYNSLMKVKIDMREVSFENADEFDLFSYHDSPVMEAITQQKMLEKRKKQLKE